MDIEATRAGAGPGLPAWLAKAPLPRATHAPCPCTTCPVRHLCLPGGLDDGGEKALDSLLIGPRRLRKGQKLYREGDAFLTLYAVRFGTFKSSFPLSDGGEHVSAFHLAGDIMGFDGLADGRHPTSVTALEHAEACAIPYARLAEACMQSAALRKRVAQLMGRQLVREYLVTKLVAHRHMEERVAGFLLQLAQWMRERGYSTREFQLRMSRADIGSYLGTTLETVSRCLSLFARLGHIKVHSRHIELLDVEALRSYAERQP